MEKTNTTHLTDFFKEEYQSLKGYVRSRIDDTADGDAEDIIQDVALRMFSRPTDSLPIDNIAGFVYRSIRNKIIDVMRTKKGRNYDEENLENEWTLFAELFYGESENGYRPELIDQLKKAVTELKPAYRDIIIAVDYEGYSYRELSERTGIPQGTLMARRHRALGMLAKKIKKEKTT